MTKPIVDFVFDNAQGIVVSSILVVLLGSVLGAVLWDRRASIRKYIEHRREVRIQRGIEMGRKQKADREAYVDGLLGEIITDGVEEAWFAGKITPDERSRCYRKVAACGIPDMLPERSQAQLKAIIKNRRYTGNMGNPGPAQERPAWGTSPPRSTKDVQLIAQHVADKGSNVINIKTFGAKALAKLKTA